MNALDREQILVVEREGGAPTVLLSPLEPLSTFHRRQNPQSCALAAAVTIPSFYQKHLESLNSYSVRSFKHSNQSFYI